ncbi:MAG: helix-turn-helix domain-containing protein [Actinomycetota bacterium]|nr:helix-turn-helix domain-containing protein [Actinomycetota bacterium]
MTTLTDRLPDLGVLLDYLPADERLLVEDAYLRTVATAPRHRAESLPPMVRSHDPETAAAAVARGLARELRTRQELVESSWSTREVARLLGVSSEAVRKRRTKGGLVAFQHRSDWRYPRWQFSGSTIVDGVPAVWGALPDRHDVFGLVRWFTLPCAQLEGRTPLEAVLAGDVARAVDAASYVGSR